MTVPPDEMIYGSTEPEDTLTAGEANLLARLREMNNWDEWFLYVNAGVSIADVAGLEARGFIETGKQMGMPAARLWRAPNTKTAPQKRPLETHEDLDRSLRAVWGLLASGGIGNAYGLWAEVLNQIDRALTIERNESYVRGMHDEHNEPLGDRLPPLPERR